MSETQNNEASVVEEDNTDEATSEEVTVESDASETAVNDAVKKAEDKASAAQDRYLRLNAEFENYKKRMTRENSNRLKYMHLDFVKELLPAVDSLERAMEHSDTEKSSGMLEGLEMVHKMVQDAFGKIGVSRIDSIGKVFDPNCHQAVGMEASSTVPENHVVEELQVGYFLHDRIVRPAMVKVSGK